MWRITGFVYHYSKTLSNISSKSKARCLVDGEYRRQTAQFSLKLDVGPAEMAIVYLINIEQT